VCEDTTASGNRKKRGVFSKNAAMELELKKQPGVCNIRQIRY